VTAEGKSPFISGGPNTVKTKTHGRTIEKQTPQWEKDSKKETFQERLHPPQGDDSKQKKAFEKRAIIQGQMDTGKETRQRGKEEKMTPISYCKHKEYLSTDSKNSSRIPRH